MWQIEQLVIAMEFISTQTYRLLSGISSNEESGYLALLEKNKKKEIDSYKAQQNFKMAYELPTAKQLGDRFRLSGTFEEESGLWTIYEGYTNFTNWRSVRLHPSPTTPHVLRPLRGGMLKRSKYQYWRWTRCSVGSPSLKMSLFWR